MHHHRHPPHMHRKPFIDQVHELDAHARYHREMLCKLYERLEGNLENLDPSTLEHITQILTEASEAESRVNAALQSMQEQINTFRDLLEMQGAVYELIPTYDAAYKNLYFEMEVDADGETPGD